MKSLVTILFFLTSSAVADLKPGQTIECTKDGGRKVVFTKVAGGKGLPPRCAYVEELDIGGIKAGQIKEAQCDAMLQMYSNGKGCRDVPFLSK